MYKKGVYVWETFNKDVQLNIIKHLEKYPLLGNKKDSLNIFIEHIKKKYSYL